MYLYLKINENENENENTTFNITLLKSNHTQSYLQSSRLANTIGSHKTENLVRTGSRQTMKLERVGSETMSRFAGKTLQISAKENTTTLGRLMISTAL